MSQVLSNWIRDAEAFEMQSSFLPHPPEVEKDFVKKQDDFYINLLTEAINILEETKSKHQLPIKKLHKIAAALLNYSDSKTREAFQGVNKVDNQLYAASIYYLTGYETIASYLLRDYSCQDYSTDAAKTIYGICSGLRAIAPDDTCCYLELLQRFIETGDDSLETLKSNIETKIQHSSYDSLDDFFDTTVLLHVIHKFVEDNIWADLRKEVPEFDWSEYVRHCVTHNILTFLPSQRDAISKGLLRFGRSFSLKMPTSAGKSHITELVIYQELRSTPNAKILYLAPLRSLSREIKDKYTEVADEWCFTLKVKYGGSSTTLSDQDIEDCQLLISTPETFVGIEERMDEAIAKFTLVICDEGQLLDSLQRGLNYELLLTRLKNIRQVRFLFLSAIIPDIERVNTWLGGKTSEVGDSKYRPCPIKFAVVKKGDGNQLDLDIKDDNYTTTSFVIENIARDRKSAADVVAELAANTVEAGPVVIYSAQKNGSRGCVNVTNHVADDFVKKGLPVLSSDTHELESIIEYVQYQFGENYDLVKCLRSGVAYHHGDLPQDCREILEKAYADSTVKVIVCNSTLAEGVNLPVHTLIIYNLTLNKKHNTSVQNVKNIIGRVGRAGKHKYGLVIYPKTKKDSGYRLLTDALRDMNIPQIHGLFYDILQIFSERNDIDDETLNLLLENLGFAKAIDTMIARNQSKEEIANGADEESVAKGTLAYHLGNATIHAQIKRVFSARYKRMREAVDAGTYDTYASSGLSIGEIEKLRNNCVEQLENDFEDISLNQWIEVSISIMLEMAALEGLDICAVREKKKRPVSQKELVSFVKMWIDGKQYWQIAQALNIEMRSVLTLVKKTKDKLCEKMQGILIFIEKTKNIDIDYIRIYIEEIRIGIDCEQKLLLYRLGLSDRIALLHFFSPFEEYCDFSSKRALRRSVLRELPAITAELADADIPELTKRNIFDFLSKMRNRTAH